MAANYIKPEIGQTYTLRNGGEYRCLWVWDADKVHLGECSAVLIRDKDGWKLTAHGVQQNEDGTIEWNYSTGGTGPEISEMVPVRSSKSGRTANWDEPTKRKPLIPGMGLLNGFGRTRNSFPVGT